MTTIDNDIDIVDETESPQMYEAYETTIFVVGGESIIYEEFEEDVHFEIEDPDEPIVHDHDDFMAWRLTGDRELTEEELNW